MKSFLAFYAWEPEKFLQSITNQATEKIAGMRAVVAIRKEYFTFWLSGPAPAEDFKIIREPNLTMIVSGDIRICPGQNLIGDPIQFITSGLANNEKIEEIINSLSGEFALILFNHTEEKIYFACDKVGYASLYYRATESGICFSSHPIWIAALFGSPEIDPESIKLYLSIKGIPAPWSMIKNIRKISPGTIFCCNKGQFKETDYWELREKIGGKPIEEFSQAKQALYETLDEAVKCYADNQVENGIFLSGGLDSAIVLSLMKKDGFKVIAFSVGYSNKTYMDETQYASRVANELAVPIDIYRCSAKDVIALVEETIPSLAEPVADISLLPQLYLAKNAAQQIKVILDGTGADGVLGGSNKYLVDPYIRIYRSFPPFLRKNIILPFMRALPSSRRWKITNLFRKVKMLVEGGELEEVDREIFWSRFMREEDIRRVLQKEVWIPEDIGKEVYLSALNEFPDHSLRAASYMTMKDIMPWVELRKLHTISVVTGLSVRSPFLYPRMVEFGLNLPDQYKVRSGQGKYILKEAFRGTAPEVALQRKKANFSPPLVEWLDEGLFDVISATFASSKCLFDAGVINKMITQNQEGKQDWRSEIWALFILQKWWNANSSLSGWGSPRAPYPVV
jgi:asparagine synthase (glutamine-hydrolysing)